MGAHVILHGEPVGVRVVTNRAIIFAGFMGVSVVDQASGVAIRAPALVAGKRPLVPAPLLGLWRLPLALGQPSAGSGTSLAAFRSRRLPSCGWAAPVHLHQGLDLGVELLDLGLVLFVPFQVIQQLLLDFEGFPTLLASVPVGREADA